MISISTGTFNELYKRLLREIVNDLEEPDWIRLIEITTDGDYDTLCDFFDGKADEYRRKFLKGKKTEPHGS